MKMIKKIIFYIAILSLSSCGYEAIYLKTAGFDKVIQSFQTEGNKKINKKIISALNLKKQTKVSGYKLIINSSRSLEIASKDSTGRASAFNLRVDVVVSLMDGDKIFKTKNL